MDRAGRELDLNLCSPRWEQQSILSPGLKLNQIYQKDMALVKGVYLICLNIQSYCSY